MISVPPPAAYGTINRIGLNGYCCAHALETATAARTATARERPFAIAPQTAFGRFVTSLLVLIGYSVIAVPTGIYTAELASSLRGPSQEAGRPDRRGCPQCGLEGHDMVALFCRSCGHALPAPMG